MLSNLHIPQQTVTHDGQDEELPEITIPGSLSNRYPLIAAIVLQAFGLVCGLGCVGFKLSTIQLQDLLLQLPFWLCVYYAIFKGIAWLTTRKRHHDSTLTLCAKGLEWHSSLKPTRKRIVPWSDVRAVSWQNTSGWIFLSRTPAALVLNCNGIADYPIQLSKLSKEQRQQLFLFLSRFVVDNFDVQVR